MSERKAASQGLWSIPLRLDDVPETGRRVELVADAETRREIAAMAGLRALPRLAATFDVTRQGASGLHVVGEIAATVGQTCVVSLDPIENEVKEELDLVFVPDVTADPAGLAQPSTAGSAALDEDEGPERLVDGTLDLGALAVEFLLLGIDPYPRKPGAVFEQPAGADAGHRPFAALAALKDKNRNKQ